MAGAPLCGWPRRDRRLRHIQVARAVDCAASGGHHGVNAHPRWHAGVHGARDPAARGLHGQG
eukprot:5684579-Prymnesium_polylepis.1